MINDVTAGIVQAIKSEFTTAKVYTDIVNQGMLDGNFSVLLVSPTINRKNTDIYDNGYSYSIRYFSKDKEYHHECQDVYYRLYYALERITVAGKYAYGSKFTYNVDNTGVLSVSVSYSLRLINGVNSFDNMQTYSIETEIDND